MSTRAIETHKIGKLNEALDVTALGEPSAGGANTRYQIRASRIIRENDPDSWACTRAAVDFRFHEGDPKDGAKGCSNEAVLAVLIDRMEGFQKGPFADERNQKALDHLRGAMACLHERTLERQERGVEGKTVA